MIVDRYNNLFMLNDYLESEASSFAVEHTIGMKERIKLITAVLHENEDLLSGAQLDQTIRFIKNVKQIGAFAGNLPAEKKILEAAAKSIAVAVNTLNSDAIEGFKAAIGELQVVDNELYNKMLAQWISNQQIPLKQLELSEAKMLEIAPWLTYLDLTDGRSLQCNDCIFTEEFIGELLNKTRNLQYLFIKNSKIEGSAFDRFVNREKLLELRIEGCPFFNRGIVGMSNLKLLTISLCPLFNGELHELEKLQRLTIEMCSSFNQELDGMPYLEDLIIWGSSVFNKVIRGMENLLYLTIRDCLVYNQKICGMKNLLEFNLWNCPAFNQVLSEMPMLQMLNVSSCLAFNGKLVGLKNLEKLILYCLPNFKQSLEEMSKLQQLEVGDCPLFNGKLAGMEQLIKLTLARCRFDHELDMMPKLRQLIIERCRFNKKIGGLLDLELLKIKRCSLFNGELYQMPNLQQFEISDCSEFNPFNQLSTALLVAKFNQEMFKSHWSLFSMAEREDWIGALLKNKTEIENIATNSPLQLVKIIRAFEIAEDLFLKHYPQYQIPFALGKIEQMVIEEQACELIQAEFYPLKYQPNYLDYLQETIRGCPALTSFLIQNLREEVSYDIEKLKISIEDLPQERRLALLPFSFPDEIVKILSEIVQEEREGWLQRPLQYEKIYGNVQSVLKRVKELNLDQVDARAVDHFLDSIGKLLNKIPFNTLAAYASVDADTLMAYDFAMNAAHKSVAIPMLSNEALLRYLEKKPFEVYRELLSYTAFHQKEAFLASDLLKNKTIEDWKTIHKQKFETQIELLKENKEKEQFLQLKLLWEKIRFPMLNAIKQFPHILQSLEKVLLKYSFKVEDIDKVKLYIKSKIDQVAQIQKELQQMESAMGELEKEISGIVHIPEEFLDGISAAPMKDPYSDNHGKRCDLTTWIEIMETSSINPFTRESLTEQSIYPDIELKKQIDAFREKHPKMWLDG